ncbi:hypothetical protein Acit_02920, partial [Aciditerrimonas ferrireducens]|nr:hypothetical protein [Aciditerrimonas ferrireducens]
MVGLLALLALVLVRPSAPARPNGSPPVPLRAGSVLLSTAGVGGYWEVTSAGDVYSFGDASFFGSAGDLQLAAPVV